MIAHNKAGREIEFSVCGEQDDIQILDALFVDTGEEVSDSDVDYILNHYAEEIYDEWFQNQVMRSEDLHDRLMDR